ncbi:MAG: ABC transporter substrate-binding protein [Treponema sp.]|jgi:putative aldouronate transport system substrate-binding protein|nr:ABC transporter substrate-binding protein [Treponema sp.]
MRKAFALILALLCAGSWAFGAGRTQQSTVPTLVWYSQAASEGADLVEICRAASDYTQEKLGVRFEIRDLGGFDRMRMVVSSGEPFDLAWIGAYNYQEFVTLGAFADITDLLPVQSPVLWNFVPKLLWDGVKADGRIYAVPSYKDYSATLFGFLDDKYVKKYNLNTTVTLDDYMANLDRIFRTIKAGEGPQFYPLYLGSGGQEARYLTADRYDDLGAGLSAFLGVRVDDSNRRVVSVMEQPKTMEAYRIVHKWYQDGIINPDAPQLEQLPRGVAFMWDQGWPARAATRAASQGIERYAPIQLTSPIVTTHTIRGSMVAVGANSRYKNEALKFLELVNSETDYKIRDMVTYGIEGRHFQYVAPRVIHRLTDTYMPWDGAYGTYFNLSVPEDQPPNVWDELRKQNAESKNSVLLGFGMDVSPVRTEIANILAVSQRYMADLGTGVADPDVTVPLLMADIRAAGFDRVAAEAQRQIDAFFK